MSSNAHIENGANFDKRIAFLDLAKCIALCWVIWDHTEASFMMEPVDNMILAVFWICSGYTTRPDFKIKGKIKLIWYYFFMSAVLVLFSVLHLGKAFTWDSFWGILYARYYFFDAPGSPANPCLLDMNNGALWFLPSLFTSYCVLKLLLKARSGKAQALLCAASLAIGTLFTFLPVLLPWSIDSAFVIAVIMCMGHWLRRYGIMEKSRLPIAVSLLLIFLCLDRVTWLINVSVRDYGNWWPSYMVTAPAGVTALLLFCRYFDRTWFARISVAFDREALFIFGLQAIFINLAVERMDLLVENWRWRISIIIISCFAGGFLAGKAYKFMVALLKTGYRSILGSER